ncbi:MAG: OmpA family protein [Flavobacteriales bacterium]
MKNISKQVILLFVVGLLGFQAQSQSMKQRVADRLYDELSFFKAVELYEDLAKKSSANAYVKRRTAECYRFVGDSKNSEAWYGKLVGETSEDKENSKEGTEGVKKAVEDAVDDAADKIEEVANDQDVSAEENAIVAEDYYHYAQMLKMNEKYAKANEMMEKFRTFSGNNSIAKAHSSNTDYVTKLKANPDRYTIAIMGDKVNTEHSDFGPNYKTIDGETKITFASARRNMALMNKDFQWDGSHFLDVYQSKLGEDGESTGVEKFDKNVKSKYHEGPASFSNNGSQMYLTRSNYLNRKKGLDTAKHNNLKLYLSEKDSNGKWGKLSEFPYNSDNYSLGHATVTEDGKTMYFSSDMPGGKGVTDIWKSTFEDGRWTQPTNVENVNTEGREMFPYYNQEGMLYFSSDGHTGLGGLDLYRSTQLGGSFSNPVNMGFPLNTNADDFAMIINTEETEGYFSSNRTGGEAKGDDDIYRFKNHEPFPEPPCLVKGCAMEELTKEKLAGVTVNLIDTKIDRVIATIVTDETGCYEFKDLPEGTYKLKGTKKDFTNTYNHEFSSEDCKNGLIEPANTLFKKRDCGLIGKIVDKVSRQPIKNATIVLLDNKNGEVKTVITDENGEFVDDLANYECPGGIIDFDLTIDKEGYLPKKVNYKKAITEPGIVRMEEDLGNVGIFAVGTDVADLCGIEDILYDFNKSYIRPDAAVELDKLVKCMNENPEMIVEIGSHTDCRASRRYNEKLSDRRAKSARKYVVSKGIAPYRIFGKGYGETRLLNGCACEPTNKSDCSEDEHQLNRRTEFRIVSGGANVKNGSTNSF